MISRAKPIAVVIGLSAAWTLLAGAAPTAATTPANASVPVYLNPAYPPEERAADLVSRLTLPEKAAEMNSSQAAAIPAWASKRTAGGTRRHTVSRGCRPTTAATRLRWSTPPRTRSTCRSDRRGTRR